MALGGVGDVIKYTLESDQGFSTEFQTVFHIRHRSSAEISKHSVRVSAALFGRGGQPKEVNPEALDRLAGERWAQIVTQVDNFFIAKSTEPSVLESFGLTSETPIEVFTIREQQVEVYRVALISTKEGVEQVRKLLSSDQVEEIVTFADKMTTLAEPQKKS